jgi:hypothetical protein
MAYSIEELEDGDTDDRTPAIISALPARAPTRTAKRGVTVATRAETQAAETDSVPPPPLPGEEPEQDKPIPISKPQLAKMHATFNELGITDRTERLNLTRALLSRDELGSANDLTLIDASTLIEMLDECLTKDNPRIFLNALAGIGDTPPDGAA